MMARVCRRWQKMKNDDQIEWRLTQSIQSEGENSGENLMLVDRKQNYLRQRQPIPGLLIRRLTHPKSVAAKEEGWKSFHLFISSKRRRSKTKSTKYFKLLNELELKFTDIYQLIYYLLTCFYRILLKPNKNCEERNETKFKMADLLLLSTSRFFLC